MQNCLILTDKNSWFNQYLEELKAKINSKIELHIIDTLFDHSEIDQEYTFCLILSYQRIIPKEFLQKNRFNLVVHASDLPQGKGMSPLTWQVLEGKNSIPITLFEAHEKLDAGNIYLQDIIELKGTELVEELRDLQAEKTLSVIENFFELYPDVKSRPQEGDESFYRKRTPVDGELDINKSIKEQFNLLRVSDNEKYPAYFLMNGIKYNLAITKA